MELPSLPSLYPSPVFPHTGTIGQSCRRLGGVAGHSGEVSWPPTPPMRKSVVSKPSHGSLLPVGTARVRKMAVLAVLCGGKTCATPLQSTHPLPRPHLTRSRGHSPFCAACRIGLHPRKDARHPASCAAQLQRAPPHAPCPQLEALCLQILCDARPTSGLPSPSQPPPWHLATLQRHHKSDGLPQCRFPALPAESVTGWCRVHGAKLLQPWELCFTAAVSTAGMCAVAISYPNMPE